MSHDAAATYPMPGEWDVPPPATREDRDLELRIWAAVRTDLNMPMGKACGQAGHAFLAACLRASPDVIDAYMSSPAQAKITLAVRDEAELVRMYEMCKEAGLPTVIVKDQGRTVFEGKTYTVMAVGPCRAVDLPKRFRRLQMLKAEDRAGLPASD